jgi:hypothetical protein
VGTGAFFIVDTSETVSKAGVISSRQAIMGILIGAAIHRCLVRLYFPPRLKLGPSCADNPFKTFKLGEMLDKGAANRLLILKKKLIPAKISSHSGD